VSSGTHVASSFEPTRPLSIFLRKGTFHLIVSESSVMYTVYLYVTMPLFHLGYKCVFVECDKGRLTVVDHK